MFRETRDTLKLNFLQSKYKGENGLLDKMTGIRGKHTRLQPSAGQHMYNK